MFNGKENNADVSGTHKPIECSSVRLNLKTKPNRDQSSFFTSQLKVRGAI